MYTSVMGQKQVEVYRKSVRLRHADDVLRVLERLARERAPKGAKLHRLVVELQSSDLVSCGWYYWES